MHSYLVRQPPPTDVDGLCYGRLDVAVDEQDVAGAAESVFAQIPSRTLARARIYCSPSPRCMRLARHIASPREPTASEDLIEMSLGRWQGIRWDAIDRLHTAASSRDALGFQPSARESR